MNQKTGWSECWCTRTVHAEGDCDTQQSSYIRDGVGSRELLEERADGLVELDGQLTVTSSHLPHKRKKLGYFESVLTEIQEFVSGRPGQHLILGGDFNVSLHGLTDYQHVEESIQRSRTLLDGDEHMDGRGLRTRAIHTLQLVGPRGIVDTNGLHHVFKEIRNETRASAGLRRVQDRSQGGVCCSFTQRK